MKNNILKRLLGWCPQPKTPTQTNLRKQNVNLFGIYSFFAKVTMALRLLYGLALIAVLFTPFAFYFSRAEPYFMGFLWGYHLPIGYVGLVLGLLVILAPKTILARKYSFGTAMLVTGLVLIISLYLSPPEYFINLIHGTNFSGGAIDVEYPIGYAVTLFVAMFSIIVGLVARISAFTHRRNRTKNIVDEKTNI